MAGNKKVKNKAKAEPKKKSSAKPKANSAAKPKVKRTAKPKVSGVAGPKVKAVATRVAGGSTVGVKGKGVSGAGKGKVPEDKGRYEAPAAGMFSRQDVVDFMGISIQAFERHWQPRVLKAGIMEKVEGKYWVKGRAFLDWYAMQKANESLKAMGIDPEDFERATSALERYQLLQGDKVEMDLRIRRGELIEVGALREYLLPSAQQLKKAIDQVQREFGDGPFKILQDAVEAYEDRIKELLDKEAA